MKESNSNQISWEYNKGITLIALIITIIIMLILATVTIKISSQGGLFEYAGKATRETTITQEREQIQEAYVYASSNSLTGEVFAEDLQSELENRLNQLDIMEENCKKRLDKIQSDFDENISTCNSRSENLKKEIRHAITERSYKIEDYYGGMLT